MSSLLKCSVTIDPSDVLFKACSAMRKGGHIKNVRHIQFSSTPQFCFISCNVRSFVFLTCGFPYIAHPVHQTYVEISPCYLQNIQMQWQIRLFWAPWKALPNQACQYACNPMRHCSTLGCIFWHCHWAWNTTQEKHAKKFSVNGISQL